MTTISSPSDNNKQLITWKSLNSYILIKTDNYRLQYRFLRFTVHTLINSLVQHSIMEKFVFLA